jgi:hypothetical protein
MKKFAAAAMSALVAMAPGLAFAETSPVGVPATGVPTTIMEFYGFVCNASNWIFAFILIIAVIMLLYGAFKFFTAGGNDDQVATARKFITYALVGVAVAILAKSLVFVVGNFVTTTGVQGGLFACP